MIARINVSKSLNHVLLYNENKVMEGTATCINAEGFGADHTDLTIPEKRRRFQQRNKLNALTKSNTMHITLSFEHDERFSNAQLNKMAERYMQQLGFGDQPYLVYRHSDTEHPHIHIVSTNIRRDGTRIPTHNIGKTIGMVAREQVEEEFGLVRAAGRGDPYYQGIVPLDLQKILDGTLKPKPSISAIVRAVISKYRCTSLQEYNAVLRQFNVVADPGEEGSLLRERGGLLYSAIDENGEKVGAQIKASAIYVHGWGKLPNNAALTLLKAKFIRDRGLRKRLRPLVLAKVEALLQAGVTMSELRLRLRDKLVVTNLHYNVHGQLFGVTFIDNEHGVVFKGSDLKKSLGAAGLQARLVTGDQYQHIKHQLLVRTVLAQTDYTAGFRSVLQYWGDQRLLVEARQLPGGELYFFIGSAQLPPSSMPPASPKIDRYLRVNFGRQNRRERAQQRAIEGAQAWAMNQELWEIAQQGLLRYSIIEELLTVEEMYEGVPYALLQEARKKRRKKKGPS